MSNSAPIGILGAGLAGLTLAWYLQKAGIPYRLIESRSEPGGYIRSVREGEYLRELGPNSLLVDTELRTLLEEMGLDREILPANPVGNSRFVYRKGAYRKLPSGPLSLVFGSFFSWKTKKAIFNERNVKSLSPEGESLAQFFGRRFSSELVDYAVNPFVAGIYAGDAAQLLASETFPSLLAYEREYGSILKGFIKNSGGQRRDSVNFRNGLQTLPNAMAQHLAHFSPNTKVQKLEKSTEGWHVTTDNGVERFQKLVVTAPAFVCAEWFKESLPSFSQALDAIYYPPMTVVHTAFRRADVENSLQGFGGLNPAVENRFSSGHLWTSSVFNHRCPPDEVLITSFIGGTKGRENALLNDERVLERLNEELQEAFGTKGSPTFQKITRWPKAIPQYDAHALPAQRMANSLLEQKLYFSANWLGGLSLSDAIRKGKALAMELVANP